MEAVANILEKKQRVKRIRLGSLFSALKIMRLLRLLGFGSSCLLRYKHQSLFGKENNQNTNSDPYSYVEK